MRQMQLLVFVMFTIFAVVTASPLENTRVERQWGGYGPGMGGGGFGRGFGGGGPWSGGPGPGMGAGGPWGGGPGPGMGGGGPWGWRRPPPPPPAQVIQRTVIVRTYNNPWR
ncbi:unnamed protein product [Heligmosomoides polygyrus]|uniref:Uncharacterized protein n=1 Tax=Heligmosomoides polygyrus TaxID=6339 RepID=A0A183GRX0_HELPZ|nr:unnamed protein product [Heligmosomoides polygyrus]